MICWRYLLFSTAVSDFSWITLPSGPVTVIDSFLVCSRVCSVTSPCAECLSFMVYLSSAASSAGAINEHKIAIRTFVMLELLNTHLVKWDCPTDCVLSQEGDSFNVSASKR